MSEARTIQSAPAWQSFPHLSPESIVVRRQDPIAVYVNEDGDVVVAQEDPYGEPDHVIYIDPSNAVSVARALLEIVGADIASEPCDFVPPKDRTAAERQRRRRSKLKEQSDPSRVTVTSDLPFSGETEQEDARVRLVAAE